MCDENSSIQMELQQAIQEKMETSYKDQSCSPACNICQSFENDAAFDSDNKVCEQLSSLFEQISTDDHEPKLCPCPKKCRMPMCSPFFKRKYIQPPRQTSCKPIICYEKPLQTFANETIYKKSFECIDPNTAACCRLPIIRPKGFLKSPDGPLEKETITKLSFPSYCVLERTKPIIPKSASFLSSGPMQEMTTQKHDFVPKFQFRRLKILPKDNIIKPCGCIEKETTQRLSFMPNCINGKRESFKPILVYKKSEIPMEFQTTQKLSFMPNCPTGREEFPWAKKAKYQPPSIEFAKDTITKLSYLAPGCFVDEQIPSLLSNIEC
ncbi:uncharacterized protein [Chironomus tepperi]|uniref:uncharacterized protein n=1 Tax=Chironomus tepperi TaxID=113505 RepID=UPI00391EE987